MNTILLIYLIMTVLHVSARDLSIKRFGDVTKVLLMPLLAWYYCSIAGDHASALVIMALVMGTLGDFFLLFPEKPVMFGIGAGAFLVGHIFYITYFAHLITSPAYMIIVAAIAVYPLIKIFKLLKPAALHIPMFCYAVVLCTVGVFAAGAENWIALCGVIFFITSDGMLGLNSVKRRFSSVPIMLTYTLAQLLLIVGILGVA